VLLFWHVATMRLSGTVRQRWAPRWLTSLVFSTPLLIATTLHERATTPRFVRAKADRGVDG